MKFQYKVIKYFLSEEELNKLGENHWELVQVIHLQGTASNGVTYFFKRSF